MGTSGHGPIAIMPYRVNWLPTTPLRTHAGTAPRTRPQPGAGLYAELTSSSNRFSEDRPYSRVPVELRARRLNPSLRLRKASRARAGRHRLYV